MTGYVRTYPVQRRGFTGPGYTGTLFYGGWPPVYELGGSGFTDKIIGLTLFVCF